jgi:hypothetical protein
MHTDTRGLLSMLRALRLVRRVLTKSTSPTDTYRTPATCGWFEAEAVARVQNDRRAMSLAMWSGRGDAGCTDGRMGVMDMTWSQPGPM